MARKIPIRAVALSVGLGLLVAGLVIAMLGGLWNLDGLVAAGFAMSAMGVLTAVVGAICFAIYGSAKSRDRSDP